MDRSDSARTDEDTAQARALLGRTVFGGMAAQLVGAAARIGVADLIGDRSRTAAGIAAELGAAEAPTGRLLRALAAAGVLAQQQGEGPAAPASYRLTAAGALLRSDRADSMRALARVFTHPLILGSWAHLEESLRTGEPAFDTVYGAPFFARLKDDPEVSALFNSAMSEGTRGTAAVLPDHFDFGPYATVVDVGGGDGTLISAILARHPHLSGILFDTAEGSAEAAPVLERSGTAPRCAVTAGDFFAGVPEGADLYLLKSVVHDWDDDRATAVLSHCRRGITDRGRLLLVEPVLPERPAADGSPAPYLSDINMLVNVGGRERTLADFEHLCARAGFRLVGVHALPPPAGYALLEAEPARA